MNKQTLIKFIKDNMQHFPVSDGTRREAEMLVKRAESKSSLTIQNFISRYKTGLEVPARLLTLAKEIRQVKDKEEVQELIRLVKNSRTMTSDGKIKALLFIESNSPFTHDNSKTLREV